MHVIIPAAGFGTRLRPHTWSKPKPLVSVAGKPILGHVLDSIAPLRPEKVVFITGYLGDQIREYVEGQYTFDCAFVHQDVMKGQAHAIQLARNEVSGPVLIAFADTIFATDLSILAQTDADGVIFVKEVDKPQAFGIVELDGDRIRRIVEKPADPPTNLAVAGVYYFRDAARLLTAIDEIMTAGTQTKGEFYLTDAIQVMIDDGARIEAAAMDLWLDCGRPETLLETNRVLLARMDGHTTAPRYADSVIIPPVVIAPSAHLYHAVVGPNASVGENVTITDAIVRDVILNHDSEIANVMLMNSIVGAGTVVNGDYHSVNIGDSSEVNLGGANSNGTLAGGK
ncbi:MAG: sugar phosphate nucleotidyltransferase [Thermomicrobiales bacterium]